MTDTIVIQPYVSKLVIWFLVDQEEVTDLVDPRNIVTDISANPTFPLVRVTEAPGSMSDHRFLGQRLVQVDCWGPGKGDRDAAQLLAETCAAVMQARFRDLVEYRGEAAVVTIVEIGTARPGTDDEFIPGKPRSTFTASIYATPALGTDTGS